MSAAPALLAELHAAGGTATLRDGRVVLRAKVALPDDLMARLRAGRDDLVAHLADPIEAAERAAIEAEPPLPMPGTPARVAADRRHVDMLDGMQRAALQRPPSWWRSEPHAPELGVWCSCCRGARWWSRDRRGWVCAECHPPPPGLAPTWRPEPPSAVAPPSRTAP